MTKSHTDIAPALIEQFERLRQTHDVLQRRVADVDQLRRVPRSDIERSLDEFLEAAVSLRTLVDQSIETVRAGGHIIDDDESPTELIEKLRVALESLARSPHTRLERIRKSLAAGEPAGLESWRHRIMQRKRDAAIDELNNVHELPDEVPGPDHDQLDWLEWFWSLEPQPRGIAVEHLSRFPMLVELLAGLRRKHWRPITAALGRAAEAPDSTIASTAPVEANPDDQVVTPEVTAPDFEANARLGEELPAIETETEAEVEVEAEVASVEQHPTFAPVPRLDELADSPAKQRVAASPTPDRSISEPRAPGILVADQVTLEPSSSASAVRFREMLERSDNKPEHIQTLPDGWPTLSEFVDTHWVTLSGEVEEAPWCSAEFGVQLRRARDETLFANRSAHSLLYARALDQQAGPTPDTDLREVDLRVLLGLVGSDPRWRTQLVSRLNEWAEHWILEPDAHPPSATTRCLFVLAATFPECAGLSADAEAMVDDIGLAPQLADLLAQLIHQGRRGGLLRLRQKLRERDHRSDEDLIADVNKARKALQDMVKERTSIGAIVPRSHCREAWTLFMRDASQSLTALINDEEDARTSSALASLRGEAEKIFDSGGVKYYDRVKMDRAAEELIQSAEALLTAKDAQHLSNSPLDAPPDPALERLVNALVADPTDDFDDEQRWLLKVLEREVRGTARQAEMPIFTVEDLARAPGMLAAWPIEELHEPGRSPLACSHPLLAAAHLFSELDEALAPERLTEWIEDNRPDLLRFVDSLTEHQQGRIELERQRIRDDLSESIAQLRGSVADLQALAAPEQDSVRGVIAELQDAADKNEIDMLLLDGWAHYVRARIEASIQQITTELLQQTKAEGSARQELERMVKERRFADLLARIDNVHGNPGPGRVRATTFRHDAASVYPNPRRLLAKLRDRSGGPLAAFLHYWLAFKPRGGPQPDDARELRNAFVGIVFDTEAKQRKTKIEERKHHRRIETGLVRDWLLEEVENPTFLPQLSQFHDITIVTIPNNGGPPRVSELSALGDERSLTIVLAPGLNAETRERCHRQLLSELHGRAIALFDDLDICRMLNVDGPRPSQIEAMLELSIEQLNWSSYCPYAIQEGQLVRMEMYVGRKEEGRRLAMTTSYSRLFSGRRLGKTALCRYVEHYYEGYRLPSRNTLRVIYVPIVGLEEESAVVADIRRALETKIGAMVYIDRGDGPREQFENYVHELLEAHAKTSLLFILDEADTFFESQIEESQTSVRGSEQQLSWTMRKLEAAYKDVNGLPRVRFVFSGYRQTFRSGGAWANWGDILMLKPLEPVDAVRLVTGPLARLGIDAGLVGDSIAFRCGYQPDLIIRFCVYLIDHLSKSVPYELRSQVRVERRHVAEVSQLPRMQEAIREVCELNFVGNPHGKMVFYAFLNVIAKLPPAALVEDADIRVHDELRKLASEHFDENDGTPWFDHVKHQLRALVSRSLLVESTPFPRSLRLRFSHHLPILLQVSPETKVREAAKQLAGHPPGVGAWLVPETVLEEVHWMHSEEALELGAPPVILFPTQWPEPLLDSRMGLASRLRLSDPWLDERKARNLDAQALEDLVNEGSGCPALVVGGAEVLRRALELCQLRQQISIIRLGRLKAENIHGWLQRARGIELTGYHASTIFMKATGGIPLVVGRVTELLVQRHGKGSTIDQKDMVATVAMLEGEYPVIADELREGPSSLRLTRRELELLHIVASASRECVTSDDLHTFLGDKQFWPSELGSYAELDASDELALSLLLHLGLLQWNEQLAAPQTSESIRPLAEEDPVYFLLEHLLR